MSTWIIWRSNGRFRRVTECNLAICFPDMPDDERIQLARQSLYELNLCVLEIAATWTSKLERLDAQVARVVGLDLLRAAAAGDTGTVVLLPHLGNWELANLLLSKHYSLTTLYRKPKSDILEEIIRNARGRTGVKLVQVGSPGVRALLTALKSGEVVSILPDQVPARSSGKFAPFFGEMTLTMTLVTNLIHRTGAKAVFCYCKRLPDSKYELVFREADDRIYDPDCGTALTALNKSVERCILECREQYQWQYKRFQFLPNFEKRDYGDRHRVV